jgi:hypothetical protein
MDSPAYKRTALYVVIEHFPQLVTERTTTIKGQVTRLYLLVATHPLFTCSVSTQNLSHVVPVVQPVIVLEEMSVTLVAVLITINNNAPLVHHVSSPVESDRQHCLSVQRARQSRARLPMRGFNLRIACQGLHPRRSGNYPAPVA